MEAGNYFARTKCYRSLQALDRAASILLKNARTSLPTEAMGKKREGLVAMLLEERIEEAKEMSSTFLRGNESSVAYVARARLKLTTQQSIYGAYQQAACFKTSRLIPSSMMVHYMVSFSGGYYTS